MVKEKLRIAFMGTPDFAVSSLKALVEENYNVVLVITAPDKPSGRGRKIQQSPIKRFAMENELPLLQPHNLKDEAFIDDLKAYNVDLQIVVAFRMLPKIVWGMPKYGSFNLHASLLPQYRGAAPINWALINGEEETGVTTFFLDDEIDTGQIILQKKEPIYESDTVESLHERLMELGAKTVIRTVDIIQEGTYSVITQDSLYNELSDLKPAPKIFKQDCQINWYNPIHSIRNFIRGLSPYPAAWTILKNKETQKTYTVKIFQASVLMKQHLHHTGHLTVTNDNKIQIAVTNGFVIVEDLQLEGKRRMNSVDFLRGFNMEHYELIVDSIK